MSSEDEYLNMETMKGGSGYYITNGTAIPVTWKKDSLQSPTRYYKEDGSEIQLNQGKTWVCVTEDTYADKIAFLFKRGRVCKQISCSNDTAFS